MAGLGRTAVMVKKPLGTHTRVLDWPEIKQCGRLIVSHNRSLGHSFLGLVQKPLDVTEVMGSSGAAPQSRQAARDPMGCPCSQHRILT